MRRHGFALAAALGLALPAAAKETAPAPAAAAPAPQKGKPADFAKLAARVTEARENNKKNGGAEKLTESQCKGFAKDYVSLAKEHKAAEGHHNAGVIYEECGLLVDAESAYRNAIDMNPAFGSPHVNLGQLAYRKGDMGRASSEFDAALKADPKCAAAYTNQALILYDKARGTNDQAGFKEAVGKLRRALALDADDVAAYSLLAHIYYTIAESDRSKLDLAELVCKQAKEVNDKYPQIYNTLGLIKLRKRNVTGALQEFKTAVQYDPAYVEAQLNIGAITLSARDYKRAEEAFKAVVDAKPSNASHLFDATIGMGVALRGQRRVDEAEQWYGKAKQLDPKSCAVAYNLGVLYQDYKSGAEPELNKAKALFNEFNACGRAADEKLKDATRRIKDIDDTFKALAEQKKLEEENKKLQEEADRMIKQQQEQEKLQQQQAPPPDGKAEGAKPDDKPAPEQKK